MHSHGFSALLAGMSCSEDVRKPEMERANALYPNATVAGNNKPVVKLSNI